LKIAIIPARGGSKRIPRKNIRLFHGKPIIEYSIEAALASAIFDVVMVSTDDPEIAAIAKQSGAEVPFMRSAESASDTAGTAQVLAEVLGEYEKRGIFFETGCCLYPCAPFVTPLLLKKALEKFDTEKLNAIFPVIAFSSPVQQAIVFNRQNKLEMLYPEHLNTRTQDLTPAYYDAGQFYFFNVKTLQREMKILTSNTSGIIIDDMEAQDIDSEYDWQLAELKFKINQLGKKHA
jgi:N-acylneuraminate cytidylyltransferase